MNKAENKSDVLIIGAGPVGIFAAFKAGMLGMKSNIVDNLDSIGGQCIALYPEKPIYDIPAYPKILAGDLIDNLKEQAGHFQPNYFLGQQIISLEKHDDYFITRTNKGEVFESKIIVIAAGSGSFGPNKPPLADIEKYENRSVFYYVDKPGKFEGKKIAIAGGGDSAIDWAIILADIAQKIYLIHRRDKFRATPASMDKIHELEKLGKIELVTPYQLDSLSGENGDLTSVDLVDFSGNKRSLDADILLPFFGLTTDLGPITNWGLGIHNHHIEVDRITQETNIPGIYAVGDVCTYEGKLKLILTGFAECATALHDAYPKVFGKALHFQHSTSMM